MSDLFDPFDITDIFAFGSPVAKSLPTQSVSEVHADAEINENTEIFE